MCKFAGRALLVCALAACVWADQDPELARAREEMEKVRRLVEAGAAPRAQLERAQAAMTDAEDAAFLRRTLYGPDLTEDQTGPMIATARRRWDRKLNELAKAKTLVEEGVASQLSLTPFLQDVDHCRKEYDLAVSRARLTHELTEMARIEESLHQEMERSPATPSMLADRFDGASVFSPGELHVLEAAFQGRFSRPLPVSALGQTAVHRALGFDHRGRVDVAVHPDQPEGVWLRQYLQNHGIPYFAFRQAVRGKSTGAHIHIGPMSTRLSKAEMASNGGS